MFTGGKPPQLYCMYLQGLVFAKEVYCMYLQGLVFAEDRGAVAHISNNPQETNKMKEDNSNANPWKQVYE